MYEWIEKPIGIYHGRGMLNNGSISESFRIKSSDIDMMYWYFNQKVISDISQFNAYD